MITRLIYYIVTNTNIICTNYFNNICCFLYILIYSTTFCNSINSNIKSSWNRCITFILSKEIIFLFYIFNYCFLSRSSISIMTIISSSYMKNSSYCLTWNVITCNCNIYRITFWCKSICNFIIYITPIRCIFIII